MSQTKVSYKRHIAKTISYRVVSTTIGFLAMWWATGSIKVAAAFGVVELIYKPIQYYFHERVWYKWIKFGLIEEKKQKPKKVVPEAQITTSEIPSKKITEPTTSGKKVLNYSSNR